MTELVYEKTIGNPPEQVWDAMLDAEGYRFWVQAFSEGSMMEGVWEEGATVRFLDPAIGGTQAVIEKLSRPTTIHVRHTGLVGTDRSVDTESEMAAKWIGTREDYGFEPANGGGATQLTIRMQCHEQFVGMFNESWPKALDRVAELCAR